MEYINGKKEDGIVIDWNKVRKIYKKVTAEFDYYYDPCTIPFEETAWNVLISKRSTGKTTNIFIIGLILHKLYGVRIEYIRNTDLMITQKNNKDLFNTILDFVYIEKIFDGEYNSVEYQAKRWYLTKVENGEIVKKSDICFMAMHSIQSYTDEKSSYNSPLGDFIIWDEFLDRYRQDTFVDACQLISTIIRDRISPRIVMMANNTNIYSDIFDELMIRKEVESLKEGDYRIIDTGLGSKVYINWIAENLTLSEQKTYKRKKFFGFKNPRLASINGGGWEVNNYQHLPKQTSDETRETMQKNIFMVIYGNVLRLNICYSDKIGYYLYVHRHNTTPCSGDIVFSLEPNKINEYRKVGRSMIISKLIAEKRVYYSTNEVGRLFNDFINLC